MPFHVLQSIPVERCPNAFARLLVFQNSHHVDSILLCYSGECQPSSNLINTSGAFASVCLLKPCWSLLWSCQPYGTLIIEMHGIKAESVGKRGKADRHFMDQTTTQYNQSSMFSRCSSCSNGSLLHVSNDFWDPVQSLRWHRAMVVLTPHLYKVSTIRLCEICHLNFENNARMKLEKAIVSLCPPGIILVATAIVSRKRTRLSQSPFS
jgi:hypothetical protein